MQRFPRKWLVFSPPKTESGKRFLSLAKQTLAKLHEHREQQVQVKMLTGKRWQDFDLILPTVIGTPKAPHNLLKDFKCLLVKADLPVIRFHDLRLTSITLLLNEVGVPTHQ